MNENHKHIIQRQNDLLFLVVVPNMDWDLSTCSSVS